MRNSSRQISPNQIQANIWKLYIIQACRWFYLLMPVLVLFYEENGLLLKEVFIVQAFYSACVIIFEIPSGYIGDRVGRKWSIFIGAVFAALGFWVYAFSYTLIHFLAAQLIIALGASFISGSDMALLYDSLLQLKRQGEYQKVAGRLASISNFSEGVAGLVGGLLALISLRTPLYCQAVLFLGLIPLAWSLVEPSYQRLKSDENSFKAILRIVHYALHGHAEIKWLILYSSLVGTSTFTIVWFVQPYFKAVDLPLEFFGIGWATLQFFIGIFALNAYRIESWLGRRNALIALILLASGAYIALGSFQTLWALNFLLVFCFVRGVNGPVLNDYINRCVSSDIRATVLSVKSLVGRVMFVVLGPLLGWINDTYSLSMAFMVCGITFFTFGVLFLVFLQRNRIL